MISATLAEAFARMAPYKGALPYSYSRAQTLLRCPLQFELQYRKRGVPRGVPSGNDETRVGWLAHKILECTVKNAKAMRDLTPAGGAFDRTFDSVLLKAENSAQKESLLKVKPFMKKVLCEIFSIAKNDDCTIFVERELQFGMDGSHRKTIGKTWDERRRGRVGLGLSGYVDLEIKRGGELLIFDYKTELPSDTRRESVERQMALYAFCELEARPAISSVATCCAYLGNAQIDRIGEYDRNESFKELKGIVTKCLDDYVAALESFEAERRENDYCRYCSYEELCRNGADGLWLT